MKVVDSAFVKMAGQEMEQVASVSILVEKFNQLVRTLLTSRCSLSAL